MAQVSVRSPSIASKVKSLLPFKEAQKIYNFNVQLAESQGEANYRRSQAREADKPELQNMHVQLQALRQAPNRDSKMEKELESQIAEKLAQWAAEDAEYEAQAKDFLNQATPHAMNILEPAIRLDIKTKQTAFNYFEETPAGMTDRDVVAECRELAKTQAAKRNAILTAPMTMAETSEVFAAAVAREASKVNVRSVRYLDFNAEKKRFERRSWNMPRLTVHDGVGSALSIPNGLGMLCALFPQETTDRLLALAMGGVRSDEGAMDIDTREAALADIDAEMLETNRRGEFFIRKCQAQNIPCGPRWHDDFRAILDVV
jgi:hypothetical protein